MQFGHTIHITWNWNDAGNDESIICKLICTKAGNLSLTKLMVSHDLSRLTVTNQMTFDRRDLHSAPEFERAMDRRYQALVPGFQLDTITFT